MIVVLRERGNDPLSLQFFLQTLRRNRGEKEKCVSLFWQEKKYLLFVVSCTMNCFLSLIPDAVRSRIDTKELPSICCKRRLKVSADVGSKNSSVSSHALLESLSLIGRFFSPSDRQRSFSCNTWVRWDLSSLFYVDELALWSESRVVQEKIVFKDKTLLCSSFDADRVSSVSGKHLED